MSWIKSTLQSVALVGVSLSLSLGMAEIALRVAGIGYSNNPLDADHQVHHRHPGDFSYLVYDPAGEFGGHQVFFNEDGYRIPEPKQPTATRQPDKNGKRIAFLGDSFTEALQVPWADSFVGRIELSNPDVTVFNFGVSSFSPIIYLVQARHVVAEFKPTDIVLQIYSNDLHDDLEYLKQANSQKVGEITFVDGGNASMAITLMRHSYLARLVKKTWVELSHQYRHDIDHNLVRTLTNPDIPEQSVTLDALAQIHRVAQSMGAALHIFIIPSKSLAVESRCCQNDTFAQTMKARLTAENIEVIDLSQGFGQAADQPSLFYRYDIHLTTAGHAIVANELGRTLKLRPSP